jgi:hypothetical protein
MAGRPPTPTALKLLKGNPGKRPLNAQEPKPEAGCEMPAYLRAKGMAKRPRELWAEESPALIRMGVLAAVDGRAFARLCVLWSWEEEAAQQKRAPLATALLAEIRQLEGQFGMTPSSRVKIKATPPAPASKLAQYRGGGA